MSSRLSHIPDYSRSDGQNQGQAPRPLCRIRWLERVVLPARDPTEGGIHADGETQHTFRAVWRLPAGPGLSARRLRSSGVSLCAHAGGEPRPLQPDGGPPDRDAVPGLDLPFKAAIQAKTKLKNTALVELMALDFAIDELGLYLTTHAQDQEALQLYWSYLKLAQGGP